MRNLSLIISLLLLVFSLKSQTIIDSTPLFLNKNEDSSSKNNIDSNGNFRIKDSIIAVVKKRNVLIKNKNETLTKQLHLSVSFIVFLIVLVCLYIFYHQYKKIKKKGRLSSIKVNHLSEFKLQKATETPSKTIIKKVIKNTSFTSNYHIQILMNEILLGFKNGNIDNEKINLLKKLINTQNRSFMIELKEQYPKLTKTDIEVCSYIKSGLSRKEIAKIRDTSLEAVKSTRFRLKKKLNLRKEEGLDRYLQNFLNY